MTVDIGLKLNKRSLGRPLVVIEPAMLVRIVLVPPSAMYHSGRKAKTQKALRVVRSSSTKSSSHEIQPGLCWAARGAYCSLVLRFVGFALSQSASVVLRCLACLCTRRTTLMPSATEEPPGGYMVMRGLAHSRQIGISI